MIQNHQKGRTIFGVIAVIAVIALLCILFIYICRTSRASSKAKEIAEAIAVRSQLYCPKIHNKFQSETKKYAQNGPFGTTINLQNEQETPQPTEGKLYFSVTVDTSSKSVCKKLIQTDVFQADLITVDENINGQCPGLIRFYFTCPYELDAYQDPETYQPVPFNGYHNRPHFTFSSPKNNFHDKLKCKEPTPYEDKKGNCVECIMASQCHESQDCVENMCQDCPEHSSRTVRIGQRIGTRNCYCQEGYQLNSERTGCELANDDWDIHQNCVGNRCSVCPENANHNKGQRVGPTDCYCEEGYLPRQTGATQWQCAKVAILYPEPANQIIIHDEKYPVEQKRLAPKSADIQKPQPVHHKTVQHQKARPAVTQPRPLRHQPTNPVYPKTFEDFNTLFEPVLIPSPASWPIPPDAGWDIQAWESLEITIQ